MQNLRVSEVRVLKELNKPVPNSQTLCQRRRQTCAEE